MLRRVVLFLLLGLLIFPALAVAQTGSTMNYPRLFATAEHSSTGIAIVNPNNADASVVLQYYSSTGALVTSTTVTVPAGGQLAQLVSQLFPSITQSGWITGTSTSANLESFWLTGNFSTTTDSAASSPVTSVVFYPLVTDRTEISVANVGTAGEAVTIGVFNQDGGVIGLSNQPIVAKGTIQGTVTQLTGISVSSGTPVTVVAIGSTTASRLAGTSVTPGYLVTTDTIVANGIIPSSTESVIPHVVEGALGGSRYSTVVGVTNLMNVAATFTLTFNSSTRAPVTVQRMIGPFGFVRSTVTELFGVTDTLGWVRISPSGSPLYGAWAAVADLTGGGVSLMNAQNTSATQMIFGHIADLNPWWTGMAVLNATTTAADLEVFAITPAGQLIDGPATSTAARFTLPAGTNRSFLLSEVAPATQTRSSDGGIIFIRSTNHVPFFAIELFFLRNGQVFANVPANPSFVFNPPGSPGTGGVDVIRALVTDTSGVEKTSFRLGETIQLVAERNNVLGTTVPVQAIYRVTGPSQFLLADVTTNASTAASGTHFRFIQGSIPSSAPVGTYTFEAIVNYGGRSSSKTVTFVVNP